MKNNTPGNIPQQFSRMIEQLPTDLHWRSGSGIGLHAMNRGLNRGLNRGMNRGMNRGLNRGMNRGMSGAAPEFSSADILPPFRELKALHALEIELALKAERARPNDTVPSDRNRIFFSWEHFNELPPPPGPDETRREIDFLLSLQNDHKLRERKLPEIIAQMGLDLVDMTRPLGIENLDGYPATNALLINICQLTSYVGLIYKDKFRRTRPNQFDPRIRPLIAVPVHSAYPSNHAFQSYSLAHVFSTLVPEETVSEELFRVAGSVARNHEIAGLHYPSDSAAGMLLAQLFLPYLLHACRDLMLQARDEWH
jgi:hypothetical protein